MEILVPQGLKGEKGDTGAQGPKGRYWSNGTAGRTRGKRGDTGAKGGHRSTGPQGLKGDTGATGPQGPKGDTGATGPEGARTTGEKLDHKEFKVFRVQKEIPGRKGPEW